MTPFNLECVYVSLFYQLLGKGEAQPVCTLQELHSPLTHTHTHTICCLSPPPPSLEDI